MLLIEHGAAVQEIVLLQTFGGVSSAEAARSGGRMGGSSFSAARSGGGSYSRYCAHCMFCLQEARCTYQPQCLGLYSLVPFENSATQHLCFSHLY